ncbi:hypothetical protein N665_1297s0003, partial [Sinapis alba]
MSPLQEDRRGSNLMCIVEEEDDDLVILPNVDNSELVEQFKLSLVGRLFNTERRSVEGLISLLPRPNIWDVEGRVRGMDLERWMPHIGDTFPNTMSFWISVMGIPTHYWMEPIFETLGSRLGKVGLIEAKSAKMQVEINVERPLKFSLRAQIPSGEIVSVKLSYSNLHRFCRNCRLISHEEENCPLIPEADKKVSNRTQEADKDSNALKSFENHRHGEPSKKTAAEPIRDKRAMEDTRRDTRDSIWKHNDSRYDPRVDSRRDYRSTARDPEKIQYSKETYNKRRYDESFVASKQREEEKRAGTRALPPRNKPGENQVHGPAIERHTSRSLELKNAETNKLQLERIRSSSPEHVRERPFKITLQKRSSDDHKLKGKISDAGSISDEGSSAKKSLKFDEENLPLTGGSGGKDKLKSWYEQTLEEEEKDKDETLAHEPVSKPVIGGVRKPEKPLSTVEVSFEAVVEPICEDEQQILEDEDWMLEGENLEFDDLMEEDDLLIDELQLMEETGLAGVIAGDNNNFSDVPDQRQPSKDPLLAMKEFTQASENSAAVATSGKRLALSPSSKKLLSPAKKKKASPSSVAKAVSLRKRNLLLGRASPKTKTEKIEKSGPAIRGLDSGQGEKRRDFASPTKSGKSTSKSTKTG